MWELVPKDRRVLRTDKHATYPGSLSSGEPGDPQEPGGDRPHDGETGAATAVYRRGVSFAIPTPERQNRVNRRLTPAYCLSYVPYTCTVVDRNESINFSKFINQHKRDQRSHVVFREVYQTSRHQYVVVSEDQVRVRFTRRALREASRKSAIRENRVGAMHFYGADSVPAAAYELHLGVIIGGIIGIEKDRPDDTVDNENPTGQVLEQRRIIDRRVERCQRGLEIHRLKKPIRLKKRRLVLCGNRHNDDERTYGEKDTSAFHVFSIGPPETSINLRRSGSRLSKNGRRRYDTGMGLLSRAGERSTRLSNHRALIIGGSGGIGRAVTYNLASHGAAVICHGGHDQDKVDDAVSYVRARGGEARGLVLELTHAGDILSQLDALVGVDIVVVSYGPIAYAPLAKTGPDVWQRIVEMNLTLPGLVLSYYLPKMVRRGWGRIVLFGGPHSGSIRGYKEIAAYGAAKLGLSSLVRSAAYEARGANVTVNLVSPGYVDTEYLTEHRRQTGITQSPQGYLIPPERIARVICDIICSEEPDVNGAVIAVDQGIV